MKKALIYLFGDTHQISKVELLSIHVLIFHAVGGFELLKGRF